MKLSQRVAERVLIGAVGFDDGQVGVQVAESGPELRDLRVVPARDRHTMTIFEEPPRHGDRRCPKCRGEALAWRLSPVG